MLTDPAEQRFSLLCATNVPLDLRGCPSADLGIFTLGFNLGQVEDPIGTRLQGPRFDPAITLMGSVVWLVDVQMPTDLLYI